MCAPGTASRRLIKQKRRLAQEEFVTRVNNSCRIRRQALLRQILFKIVIFIIYYLHNQVKYKNKIFARKMFFE